MKRIDGRQKNGLIYALSFFSVSSSFFFLLGYCSTNHCSITIHIAYIVMSKQFIKAPIYTHV
jgi:hypothetical protein